MIEIVVSLCILIGVLFMAGGSLGLIRLPDTYSRINGMTKGATFGVIFTMLGCFLFFILEEGAAVWKILLTIGFVMLTAPVTSFVVARAAYHTKMTLAKSNHIDDLGPDIEKKNSAEEHNHHA